MDDVTFQVQPGELVGFLGPNGAGKSTCMRILTTWLPASSGYASLAGFDVMYQSMEVRKRIGYLPESVPAVSRTAGPRVSRRTGPSSRASNGTAARPASTTAWKSAGSRKCRTVSSARSRRAIGSGLGWPMRMLADPPILILDEPTSGLDPVQIGETLNAIKELGGKHTVLLSTHILSEVEKVCERVIIINKGRIKFDDTMKAIENREQTLLIEIRGPIDPVSRFLQEQPELSSVASKQVDSDLTTFDLKTRDRYKDFREELARRVVSKGWGIRRLELRREKLEDLFTAVVLRQSEPAASPPSHVPEPTPTPVA